MMSEEVVYSLYDFAKKFILEYQNPNIDQKVIDAIIVDFINFCSSWWWKCDLVMHTNNLRDCQKINKCDGILQKDSIRKSLDLAKMEYENNGIIESVNNNCYTNECCGQAYAGEREAAKVIEKFIEAYIAS